MDDLESWVVDENRTVTYRWISNELSISSTAAKDILLNFYEQKKGCISATFLLSGDRSDGSRSVSVIAEEKLEGCTTVSPAYGCVFRTHIF